jgi:DNA polymerase-3 subunit delta'
MIYGHGFQKEYFKKVVESNRFGTSYIFDGKEGVGKKLFAIYLAKYFFCENKIYFEDCNCKSCINALNYKHISILFLGEEQLKIGTIRGLNEFIYLSGGSIKFIIIDSIHKITKEAAAAFLKTLEESPTNVVFILITHDYLKVLPTIRSRCYHIPFNRLKDDEVSKILNQENNGENFTNYYFTGSVSEVYKYKAIFEIINFFKKNDIKELNKMLFKINDKDELKTFLYASIFYIRHNLTTYYDIYIDEIFELLYLLIRRIDDNVNIEIIKSMAIILIAEVINGIQQNCSYLFQKSR